MSTEARGSILVACGGVVAGFGFVLLWQTVRGGGCSGMVVGLLNKSDNIEGICDVRLWGSEG